MKKFEDLTEYELEQFETAYKHIQSVALGYDKYKNPTDFSKIRIGMDRESGKGETVPRVYFPMASELARVLSKEFEGITPIAAIAHAFTPLYKEKAIKWLFTYCVKNRVQPSEFAVNGYVWIDHNAMKSYVPHTSVEYTAEAVA